MIAGHSGLLAGAGLLLGAWGLPSVANGAPAQEPGFILESSTFKDGELVPLRIAFKSNAEFPYCFGENVSPALSWRNPRPGVKSYALTVFEIEDPPHSSLVAYGIAASVTSFTEGEFNKPSEKYVAGRNFRNTPTWRGMCPPPNIGTSTHHYQFTVWGTDLDPKELPPGLTQEELVGKLKGHAKEKAILIAAFKRPS